jgi:hypothetical protein
VSPNPGFTERRLLDEHSLFPGIVTSLFALAGCWLGRRRHLVAWATGVGVVALGLVLVWPGGVTAWRLLYPLLPGAEAIRGVSRIVLPLLLVVGLGVGLALEWIATRRRTLAALAVAVIVLEQGQTPRSFAMAPLVERSRFIAATAPASCDAFLYTVVLPKPGPLAPYQLEAMWASLFAGKPTVNGYSGYPPRGWWELTSRFLTDRAQAEDLPELANELAALGSPLEQLCWLRLDVRSVPPTGAWMTTRVGSGPTAVTTTPVSPDAAVFMAPGPEK